MTATRGLRRVSDGPVSKENRNRTDRPTRTCPASGMCPKRTNRTNRTPPPVIPALPIRDKGTCELRIPAAKFDAFVLIGLIGRHGGTLQ